MPTLEQRVSETLKKKSERDAILGAVTRALDSRTQTLEIIPGGSSFRNEVQTIKQRCVACLDELVEQFSESAAKRGAKIYHAKTAEDACNYVLKLAKEKNAKLITKSKSLTTEEIELNLPLEAAGIKVVETDLGEYIIQLAKEPPYHLVFPAVHKTAQQVAQLFEKATGEKVSSELDDLMALVRRTLRPIFLHADIGVTGVNVAIAETGAALIETNEGNGRLVSALPPVHVCIMGMEKIVGTIEEALQMIFAHPVSATGQLLTSYVSFFAGRSPMGAQAGREFHIVILDNGRTAMRKDSWYREALHCIRCGACMNICPTYGVLGGHVFGHIYPGPIGIPWTAQTHGFDKAAQFSDLCISCGLCKEICPADIDIPMMIAKVKHESRNENPQPLVNKVLMAGESIAKLACATAPVSNWILQSRFGKMVNEKVLGIDSRRTVPRFTRKTFKKQFRKKTADGKPAHKVAFFVDYFANYVNPDLALVATQFLQKAQVEVVLPKQKSSGYPYISYGELDKARKAAEFNVAQFHPFVKKGNSLVTTEPTAAYAFKQIYPKLLDHSPESTQIAEKTFEFFEFIAKLMDDGFLLLPPQMEGRLFGFHLPCHQRGGSCGEASLKILRSVGYEVEVIETGTCCGMAGTFGMKHGPMGYDLSTIVGEPLFDLFKKSEVEAIITESSVCKMQLEDGTGLPVYHPLELINPV